MTPGAAAAEGTDANAAASASAALASAFPLRVAYFSTFDPRERVGITLPNSDDAPTLVPVDDARLPGLDTQLAAYPFSQLDSWRALTGAVSSRVVQRVRGNVTFIDSLTGEEGGDEIGALREAMAAGRGEHVDKANEQRLQFPVFDLKRSWAEGASGDARTCWSRDKSWLLAKVCADVGGECATHYGL